MSEPTPRRASSRGHVLTVLLLLCAVACGGDDAGNAPGQPGAPGAPPPAPPTAVAAGSGLTAYRHIEDVVPEAEKATIRRPFHDHDFLDSNRDPFGGAVGVAVGSGSGSAGPIIAKVVDCKSKVIAPNYSYADLKLVGIVAQGTQHKVLMMDPGNLGRIIGTGECVGKEKAVVKEIAQNYVTFLVTPEAAPGQGGAARSEEYSIKLHEHDLDVTTQTDLSQPTPETETAPVLPSTGRLPGQPGPPSTQPVLPAQSQGQPGTRTGAERP
jgi:Tfp pilus assembly protein PilP|nr:hypothetical protein [Kofleriaceae bacterium]